MAGAAQNMIQAYGEKGGKVLYNDNAKLLHVKDKKRHSDQTMSGGLQYTDADYEYSYIKLEKNGTWSYDRQAPGKEYKAEHGIGFHKISYPDGSQQVMNSGNVSEANKQGVTKSNMGNADEQQSGGGGQGGMFRGNKGSQGGDGGSCQCTAGNVADMGGGMNTQATSGNMSASTTGKMTMNAEGGIGMGVNKGSSMKGYMRIEPDGTFHVQVTPAGNEGGNATVKINPDGSIELTSKASMKMDVASGITMKTSKVTVDAAMHVTGAVTTDSSITSAGVHTAAGHT